MDKLIHMKPLMKQGIILSEMAYLEPDEIHHKLAFDGFQNFDWIEDDKTDTQAFVVNNDSYAWVTIRGTELDSLEDWLTNLDCRLVPHDVGRVHAGFQKDVIAIKNRVQSALIKHRIAERPIICTGHSQGAAESILLFRELWNDFQTPKYCIPIEPPRTLDLAAVMGMRSVASRIHATINNNDIVCRVPTRAMGYNNPDWSLWYFDEDGKVHHDISWWERFKDRIHGRINDLFELGTDGVKDHSCSELVRLTEDW